MGAYRYSLFNVKMTLQHRESFIDNNTETKKQKTTPKGKCKMHINCIFSYVMTLHFKS